MRYDKQQRRLAQRDAEIKRLKDENQRLFSETKHVKEILDSTLHEVRRFSAQLTKFSERLSRDTDGQAQLNQAAQSIFYTAGMLSSRLAYTDIELNPRAIESQTAIRSGIYKKFDKAKRILAEEARNKGVTVQLIGESRDEIDALPVFELLPFVLLENSVKYSPQGQAVTVRFERINGRQTVSITSVGPAVADSELPHLFEKGYRGAQVTAFTG